MMTKDNAEAKTMDVREMKTITVSDNSLVTRFKAAINNRPDWAQSFTATMIGRESVRVTYSDSSRFGVDIQAAWNYIERH